MAGRKRDNERDRVCFVRLFYFVSFIVYLLLPTSNGRISLRRDEYEEISSRGRGYFVYPGQFVIINVEIMKP